MCCHETLSAPKSFRNASEEERARVSNGCGPASALFDVVPDNILGVSIGCACDIHDWEYEEGLDKELADLRFYRNLRTRIDEVGGWLRRPRLFIAWWYFRAVTKLGHDAFKG